MHASVTRIGLGTLSFGILLLAWTAVSASGLFPPFFLPGPGSVVRAARFLFAEEAFVRDIGVSILRILGGFALGAALAIPCGIAIGTKRFAEWTLEPVIDFIRYTPTPAFIPLFILWFGIGEFEKIFIIFNCVFFQMTLMVANSVGRVPSELVESALTLGATRLQVFTRVVWPNSLPHIVDDMRISLGWAWAGLLMAEMVGSTSGIGFVIIQSQRLLQTPSVIAALLTVGAFGLSSDLGLKKIHAIAFPWISAYTTHAHS